MLELIMIFSLALLCAAIGLWALRRPAADGVIDAAAVPAASVPELVPANDSGRAPPIAPRAPTRPADVQAPAAMPGMAAPPPSTLAILEFEVAETLAVVGDQHGPDGRFDAFDEEAQRASH